MKSASPEKPGTVRLARAHYPVTALGPGRRIGLWFQGCGIGCPGCTSIDTWPSDENKRIETRIVLGWCATVAESGLDGVTITGGEPFDQPLALLEILTSLRRWRDAARRDFDILLYSGYPLSRLRRDFPDHLEPADAIIPEPYVDTLPPGGRWRGSANQPLVPLTARGRERYAAFVDAPRDEAIQVAADRTSVHYVGIPGRGDMERAAHRMTGRGVVQKGRSWTR